MFRNDVSLPTLGELSGINEENNPGRTALIDSERRVSWREFEEESRRAAGGFDRLVDQGDRVAFLCESSVEQTILWNGALKTGAVVTNLHYRAASETIAYCLESTTPKVLVIDAEFSEYFAAELRSSLSYLPSEIVVVGETSYEYETSFETFVADSQRAPDTSVSEDDIAIIGWTSGTTGRPKGWCHTHRSVVLKGMSQDVQRTTRRITATTPSFMAWYNNIVPVALAGGTLIYVEKWDPKVWVERVQQYDATMAGMVPTMWREVLELDDLDDYDLSSLESITFTGEKISVQQLKRLRNEICEDVQNAYASTELNIAKMGAGEMTESRIESVGKPDGGTRVRVIDRDGSPEDTLECGEVGEIIVKGPDCPVWVWGDTETTKEEFTDGWWYSGDLGYKDEEGYLYVEGRKDFIITTKGVSFNPIPVEELLETHPSVDEAAVVGIEDEEFGQRVTAIVKSTEDVTAGDLDEWCLDSDEVADYQRPREYQFVDSPIARTSTGKLDRETAKEYVED